jgi:hypothetical protein
MGNKVIVTKQRGKKKYVTSSYFADLRLLRQSRFETDYRDLKRNTKFNTEKLQLAYVVQMIKTWKMGCQELSAYIAGLNSAQVENTVAVYEGRDYIEDDDSITSPVSDYIPSDEVDET